MNNLLILEPSQDWTVNDSELPDAMSMEYELDGMK